MPKGRRGVDHARLVASARACRRFDYRHAIEGVRPVPRLAVRQKDLLYFGEVLACVSRQGPARLKAFAATHGG